MRGDEEMALEKKETGGGREPNTKVLKMIRSDPPVLFSLQIFDPKATGSTVSTMEILKG